MQHENMSSALILKRTFEDRSRLNPRYSLRAFARDLNLAASTLSAIFNGKQNLSVRTAKRIATRLGLKGREERRFIDLVTSESSTCEIKRVQADIRLKEYEDVASKQITLDMFAIISDWYHYAILELTRVENFRGDFGWIAKTLGISEMQAKLAVERLGRVGLLQIKGDKWIDVEEFVDTAHDIPSDALKRFHRQLLEKALSALITQSVDEREVTGMVVSIDKKNLAKAKNMMRNFREEFTKDVSKSSKKDSVYYFGMQFIKLTE